MNSKDSNLLIIIKMIIGKLVYLLMYIESGHIVALIFVGNLL